MSIVRRTRCLALLLLLSLPSLSPRAACAQYAEAQPGARVRVQAPGIVAGRYVGTVLAREPGLLRIGSQNTPPVEVPLDRITALEISRGSSRWAGVGRGAVVGTVTGAALGLLIAAFSNDADRTYWDAGRRDTLSRAGLVGYTALSGAFWGGAIGALIPKERWDRFDVTPRVGADVRRGRAQLGLRLAY
jgi:hypothetical protein